MHHIVNNKTGSFVSALLHSIKYGKPCRFVTDGNVVLKNMRNVYGIDMDDFSVLDAGPSHRFVLHDDLGHIRPVLTEEQTMNTVTIIISRDNDEGEQFAAWLQQQGHTASVGNSTGNYINGALTSSDAEANETMRMLWNSYCNA